MDHLDTKAMELELAVLRMEFYRAEIMVEDAIGARTIKEEELQRMRVQQQELEETHKSGRANAMVTPGLFPRTPSYMVSSTLRDTSGVGLAPANTLADTEFSKEQTAECKGRLQVARTIGFQGSFPGLLCGKHLE